MKSEHIETVKLLMLVQFLKQLGFVTCFVEVEQSQEMTDYNYNLGVSES